MVLYSTEVEKVIERIKKSEAKLVCLQLPDGMKTYAKEIADKISQETKARVLIWLGSNFGSCDIPLGLSKMRVDLLVSWGHNFYHKKVEGW
ncbi:MAG TPA: diphthamide synthesis protein [Candidatus Nanoarchaeia archaeon]|nr:diphthamide synthesis protein [Candidatus Nanoarchaeia archaeon]